MTPARRGPALVPFVLVLTLAAEAIADEPLLTAEQAAACWIALVDDSRTDFRAAGPIGLARDDAATEILFRNLRIAGLTPAPATPDETTP